MATETNEATVTTEIPDSKVVASFKLPTPTWATWVFRSVFNLSTAAVIWIAATNVVPEGHKVEIMLALKVLDYVIWGMARGLGVKKEDFESQQ